MASSSIFLLLHYYLVALDVYVCKIEYNEDKKKWYYICNKMYRLFQIIIQKQQKTSHRLSRMYVRESNTHTHSLGNERTREKIDRNKKKEKREREKKKSVTARNAFRQLAKNNNGNIHMYAFCHLHEICN